MIQALWQDWTNSAQKSGGGGSTRPVIARDGETEPWHFTMHGLTATAHVETLLDDLLDAYTDGPEMLAAIIDDGEDWKAVLCWLLALGTLEGQNFTGMVVARAAELPWEDVEDVLDALVDAGLLADAPDGYDTLEIDDGQQPLYRYTFALPIWWHLFRRYIPDDELREDAGYMAEALEHCYGPLAWHHLNTIVRLWELAGNPAQVQFQRRVLEQRAYIDRLKVRALLAQQHAETHKTWLDAHRAWQRVADEMCGYVSDAETFATYERAQECARHGGSRLAEAETLVLLAHWANAISDNMRAEAAINKGLVIIDGSDDAVANRTHARLLHELGTVHQMRNELELALRYLEQACRLKEAHGTPHDLVVTLFELGRVHRMRNELELALRYLEQARQLKEAHSTPRDLAGTLYELGTVHRMRNELELALRYLEQARRLEEAHGTPRDLAATLHNLGHVYDEHGDSDAALPRFEQAIVVYEKISSNSSLGHTLHCFAKLRLKREEYAQALTIVRRALDIKRSIQSDDIEDTETLERRILEAMRVQDVAGEEG